MYKTPSPLAYQASTPSARGQFVRFCPPGNLSDNLSESYESEDGSFDFFRVKKRYAFDSTESGDDNESELSHYLASETHKPLVTYVYIDDFNSVESASLKNAPAHYSTSKAKISVRANKSERLFGRINNLATDIGMKVNCDKTQMLRINSCVHNNVSSFIGDNDNKITSTNVIKLLGFNVDCRPNASRHVELLIEKFYSRLWTLRFLKKSRLSEVKLLEMYNTVLRSAVESCSVVYHSMIPKALANKLESIQRQALRIIYGWNSDIDEVMSIKSIESLEERRMKAVLNFALKNERKERYGKRWLRETTVTDRPVRNREKYIIPFCRTERMKANPLVLMTHLLNEHYSK